MVIFELGPYTKPKVLSQAELRDLLKRFKTTVAVGKHIGASQSFVSFKLLKIESK